MTTHDTPPTEGNGSFMERRFWLRRVWVRRRVERTGSDRRFIERRIRRGVGLRTYPAGS
jgi:hypothetical protein